MVFIINFLSSVKKKNDPLAPPEECDSQLFDLKSYILFMLGFTEFMISISFTLSN
jgi:hypothetical protein